MCARLDHVTWDIRTLQTRTDHTPRLQDFHCCAQCRNATARLHHVSADRDRGLVRHRPRVQSRALDLGVIH